MLQWSETLCALLVFSFTDCVPCVSVTVSRLSGSVSVHTLRSNIAMDPEYFKSHVSTLLSKQTSALSFSLLLHLDSRSVGNAMCCLVFFEYLSHSVYSSNSIGNQPSPLNPIVTHRLYVELVIVLWRQIALLIYLLSFKQPQRKYTRIFHILWIRAKPACVVAHPLTTPSCPSCLLSRSYLHIPLVSWCSIIILSQRGSMPVVTIHVKPMFIKQDMFWGTLGTVRPYSNFQPESDVVEIQTALEKKGKAENIPAFLSSLRSQTLSKCLDVVCLAQMQWLWWGSWRIGSTSRDKRLPRPLKRRAQRLGSRWSPPGAMEKNTLKQSCSEEHLQHSKLPSNRPLHNATECWLAVIIAMSQMSLLVCNLSVCWSNMKLALEAWTRLCLDRDLRCTLRSEGWECTLRRSTTVCQCILKGTSGELKQNKHWAGPLSTPTLVHPNMWQHLPLTQSSHALNCALL